MLCIEYVIHMIMCVNRPYMYIIGTTVDVGVSLAFGDCEHLCLTFPTHPGPYFSLITAISVASTKSTKI